MKNYIIISVLSIFITSSLFGQIGIGSNQPRSSAIVDLNSTNKAVLFPKVALVAMDSKAPLVGNIPNGTLIFNTNVTGSGDKKLFTGYYEWYEDRWRQLITETTNYKVAKFNNAKSTSDLNVNWNPSSTSSPLNVSIFGNAEFNDDSTLFEKIDNNSIKINEVGTYLVVTNLGLQLFPIDTRYSTIEIYFNYALNGNVASSKVLSRVPQQYTSVYVDGRFFFKLSDYVNVTTPGQILTLQAWRNNTFPNDQFIRYDANVNSSIVIQKLR